MKKSIYFLVVAATLASCGKTNYTIEGAIQNASVPPKVYLNLMRHDGAIGPIDSTAIAEDGKFKMFGNSKRPEVGFLQFSNEATFPIIIEKGAIGVKINYQNWDDFEISGTPDNDVLNSFHSQYRKLWVAADSAYKKFNRVEAANVAPKADQDSLRADVLAKYGQMLDFSKAFVTENKSSIVSVAALWFVHKGLTPADYKNLSNIISADLKYSPLFDMMQKQANGQLPM